MTPPVSGPLCGPVWERGEVPESRLAELPGREEVRERLELDMSPLII